MRIPCASSTTPIRPPTRAVAAVAVALFEANEHAFDLSKETRAIVLKLSHLVAAAIYDMDGQ